MLPLSLARTAVAQLTRIYAEPLLACVADNRKMMRDAAITALDKVTTVGGEKNTMHFIILRHSATADPVSSFS